MKRDNRGKKNPNYNPTLDKVCSICKNEYHSSKKFCSKDCYLKWLRSEGKKGRGNNFKRKGKPGSFLGHHHSFENKQFLRELKLNKTYEEIMGEEKAKEVKNKLSILRVGKGNSFYGKKHSKATKNKISEKNKGKKCWNKSLTKETDNRVRKGATTLSKIKKEQWKNDEYFKKRIIYFRNHSPNKKEIIFNDILQKFYPNEWKFVGNGQFWINRMNPDFLNVNGKKTLIEFLGCYYHACPLCYPKSKKKDNFEQKKKNYLNFGFRTLCVWEHELNDISSIKDKIDEFNIQY